MDSIEEAKAVVRSHEEYSAAEEMGDTVIFHGIARGSLTPPEGDPVPLADNFILTLKRDESGIFRFWRGPNPTLTAEDVPEEKAEAPPPGLRPLPR